MSTLKCKDVVEGMRVKLTNPDIEYEIEGSNPVVGSPWECKGTVVECDEYEIIVDWDNLYNNTYKDDELSLAEDTTLTGVYIDFWHEI